MKIFMLAIDLHNKISERYNKLQSTLNSILKGEDRSGWTSCLVSALHILFWSRN